MSLPDAASLEAPSLAELRALVGVLVAEVRSLHAENQALRDEGSALAAATSPSGPSPAGSAVDLRTEMAPLAALSNRPHPLDPAPAYAPQPVEAVVWASAPVAADDPCRTGSPEAVRAFENNARSSNG